MFKSKKFKRVFLTGIVVLIFLTNLCPGWALRSAKDVVYAAPDQPVVPRGRFEICVVNQQEEPVAGAEFSIHTETDNDVVTGFTADDGCRSGDIIAGPAHFEAGTGIVHDAVIRDGETVFERFTVPAFKQYVPKLGN